MELEAPLLAGGTVARVDGQSGRFGRPRHVQAPARVDVAQLETAAVVRPPLAAEPAGTGHDARLAVRLVQTHRLVAHQRSSVAGWRETPDENGNE